MSPQSKILRSFRTYLTVVERARYRDVVHVLVQDGGHLGLLNRAHTTLGVQDEDGDIFFPTQAVYGGGACVAACCTDDS